MNTSDSPVQHRPRTESRLSRRDVVLPPAQYSVDQGCEIAGGAEDGHRHALVPERGPERRLGAQLLLLGRAGVLRRLRLAQILAGLRPQLLLQAPFVGLDPLLHHVVQRRRGRLTPDTSALVCAVQLHGARPPGRVQRIMARAIYAPEFSAPAGRTKGPSATPRQSTSVEAPRQFIPHMPPMQAGMPQAPSPGVGRASGSGLEDCAANVEKTLSMESLPQLQRSGSGAEPRTSASKRVSQSSHLYSKIGMALS